MKTQVSLFLLFQLLLSSPGFSQVVEERVTENNGMYQVCGEGDGLNPCRDVNGETYEEEMGPADVKAESNNEIAAEAARIRNESPQELEATIRDMEQE
jgi:hypothetical protein